MYEYLDKRYAIALYEVAEENGTVDEYIENLKIICDLMDNDKSFYEFIKNPQVGTRNKKRAFINIFKNKIDEDLLSFLLILIEKERILHLREKVNEMEKIILEKNFKSNYSLFKEIVRRFIYTNLLKCIWIKLLLILSK